MAVAEPNLTRTLLRLNGTTRKSVGVVLINDDTGIKQADRSTDEFGRFSINYSRFADGTYHLEYYGDGIIPTVFSSDGNVLVEDPVTPWEYDIYLKNPTAITSELKVFKFLVFKKEGYYSDEYDL